MKLYKQVLFVGCKTNKTICRMFAIFVGVTLRAYENFSERFETIINRELTSAERLVEELEKSFEHLSRADLENLLQDIGQRTIERALAEL